MIHELRVYHCVPGKLPALINRFETITFGFWKTYGIRHIGFWTTEIGDNNQELHYILEWESLAEREQKWSAFQADAKWIAKRAETEAHGPIVGHIHNRILKPVPFKA